MKKALFIDRDGTLIVEPADEQVDSFEKLRFVPGAISGLKDLSGLGYELVLATNQDGLGTPSFPEETFWPVHEFILDTLEGEGIVFDDQLIDRHFPDAYSPERKPGTGMFGRYKDGSYDLAASYVIGDRPTDIALARNLGARGILLQKDTASLEGTGLDRSCVLATDDWAEVADFIRRGERCATVERKTRETDIRITVDLDGRSPSHIDTGLRFFDHMLEQLVHHGGISLELTCQGDLDVDEHHTMEDCALALGQALQQALGDKAGIGRYGFVLPMDECRAMVLLDFGGRAELVWDVRFTREFVGDTPTEMFKHFFKSLSSELRCNLHVAAKGENNHHLAESLFKAFARALRQAIRRQPFDYAIPSSKGSL
ncbi:MAG: bifunctional histidinol-phosphatase/imidazoleglycerol-phosphate dehydratase HisB [Bacteroidales bacterium]|nr:bifunctional histidinol-phosphatase/imidazoleglycerol-phosphate dehydratase HisB [Bacteroidales bacterium]